MFVVLFPRVPVYADSLSALSPRLLSIDRCATRVLVSRPRDVQTRSVTQRDKDLSADRLSAYVPLHPLREQLADQAFTFLGHQPPCHCFN